MIKLIKKILKYIFRRFDWRFEKLYQRSDYNLETPNIKLLECLSKSKGIFHLGAHRGEEAPIYEWFGKKALWVEANPFIFDELKDNLIKYKYQKAYKALIYDKDYEEVDFYLSSNDYASSSIFKFGDLSVGKNSLWYEKNLRHEYKIRLKTLTIDTLLKNNLIDISLYDHWVLDLQGAELLALRGAQESLKKCNSLYIEVSKGEVYQKGVQWDEIKYFLEKNNFFSNWDLNSSHSNVLFTK